MVKFSIGGTGEGSSSVNWRKRERTASPVIYSSLCSATTSRSHRPRLDPDVDGQADDENYWEEDVIGEESDGHVCKDEIELRSNHKGSKDVILDQDDELSMDSGALTVTFADPEVLDCPICLEGLTIPVYQCDNGHTACSSCCLRLGQKCPSCSLPIGYNRCRAIEKVLESVRIPCANKDYGCNQTVVYNMKQEHSKTCIYAACTCPVTACSFTGSYKQTYQHAKIKHTGPFVGFNFDNEFLVFFNMNDKVVFLQEEEEGVLFFLKNEREGPGNIITISRLGPSSLQERNYFDLSAATDACDLRLRTFAKLVLSRHDFPGELFLMVPIDMFGSSGQICMNLIIWRDGKFPADMRSSPL